ncbi:MAG: Spi family protease inhibitor [Prevotella sp.]|nr:Spi family protease inhibitor [Prevotella sp.]
MATEFFAKHSAKKGVSSLKIAPKTGRMSTMSNTTDNLLYIVNRGENNGYAIIAGDNRVSPILAFSETGSLTQTDLQRHPALNWMLSEYEKQIKWAMTHLSDRPFKATARKADANRTPIEPLLEYENDRKTRRERPIQWGQGWPFNAYTPSHISIGGPSLLSNRLCSYGNRDSNALAQMAQKTSRDNRILVEWQLFGTGF